MEKQLEELLGKKVRIVSDNELLIGVLRKNRRCNWNIQGLIEFTSCHVVFVFEDVIILK